MSLRVRTKLLEELALFQSCLPGCGDELSPGSQGTNKDNAIAKEEFGPIKTSLNQLIRGPFKSLQDKLEAAGAPYTPYRIEE